MAEANEENNKMKESAEKQSSDGNKIDLNIHWVNTHPECAVCLQPCLQPVELPCKHVFCFLCVKGFAYRSRKCALCRREVTLEYFESPVIVKVQHKEQESSVPSLTMLPPISSYDWFYEGRNGWWQYDERASSILEEAFKGEARSCELLVAGFLYIVDFENMIQYRKSNQVRRRRVKRDKANVERKGVAGLKSKVSGEICTCESLGELKEKQPLCCKCKQDKKIQETIGSVSTSEIEENVSSETDIQRILDGVDHL